MQADQLERLLRPCKREVRRYYGPMSQRADIGLEVGVIVCTIEKANTLINRLIEQQQLSAISCVVVDELHMVVALILDLCREYIHAERVSGSHHVFNHLPTGPCVSATPTRHISTDPSPRHGRRRLLV